MVQLSSPKPDLMPVPSGNQKMRTVSQADQAVKPEKSGFSRTLEKQKAAKKKDNTRDLSEQKKTGKSPQAEAALVPEKEINHAKKSGKSEKPLVLKGALPSGIPLTEGSEKKSLPKLSLDPARKKTARKTGGQESYEGPVGTDTKSKSDKNRGAGAVSLLQAKESFEEEDHPGAASPEEDPPVASSVHPAIQEGTLVSKGEDTAETTLMTELKGAGLEGKKRKLSAGTGDAKKDHSKIITVEDRRTVKTETSQAVFAPAKEQKEDSLTLEMAPQQDPDGTVLAAEPRNASQTFLLPSAEEQKGSFLLNKQLQEGGTKELAKNIRFILKDKNQGEIKLILKPESLGKVRIQLNLQENNIVGKIFVENNTVKQIFMNNLPDLAKALEDSGFQASSLDVSVGGGETGRRDHHRNETPAYFHGEAADLESQIPVVFDSASPLSQIDLVV